MLSKKNAILCYITKCSLIFLCTVCCKTTIFTPFCHTSLPPSRLAGNEMRQVFDFTWLVSGVCVHRPMKLAKGDQWEISCSKQDIFHLINGVCQLVEMGHSVLSHLSIRWALYKAKTWLTLSVAKFISLCYRPGCWRTLVLHRICQCNMLHETVCYHYNLVYD